MFEGVQRVPRFTDNKQALKLYIYSLFLFSFTSLGDFGHCQMRICGLYPAFKPHMHH